MKFIDLKTGETFATGTLRFCGEHIRNRCASCPMKKIQKTGDCKTWVMQHPLEAAKLMGYGIVGTEKDEIKFAVPVNNPSLAGNGGNGSQLVKREKPPVGIEPEYIWKEKRYEELCKAVGRYLITGREIPMEWMEEGKRLFEDIGKTNQLERGIGERIVEMLVNTPPDRTFWDELQERAQKRYYDLLDNVRKAGIEPHEEDNENT